jgi:two-component system response regulator RegA
MALVLPLPVLVVDDSPVALLTLTRRLRSEGVEVRQATSATEALGIDANQIAGALLDLDLGDGTGVDVAEAFRAAVAGLPIAFFSAGAAEDTVAKAKKIGAVFTKPDDIDRAVAWAKGLVSPS